MQQGPQMMNCFLCHLDRPNLAEWRDALQADEPDWAVAATLIGAKVTLKGGQLLEHSDAGYEWNADALNDDELAVIPMAQPRAEHCGTCHGLVQADNKPLALALGSDENWGTETTGQVFSSQRIRHSALNLRDKDDLGRAWDIHAQRLVECRDCHYAKALPEHLITAGRTDEADHSGGPRVCASCHQDTEGHDWLPEPDKHFAALACEACHVPQVYLPARQQVDASVITQGGEYLITYRGLAQGSPDQLGNAYVTGYRPLLIRQADADGTERWTPVNLISRWYWIDATNDTPVSKARLQQAWLENGRHAPAIVALFDGDGDGQLQDTEIRLDSAAKVELIAQRLSGLGVGKPELRAGLDVYHLHHNVALKEAQRDCKRCHETQNEPAFAVAAYLPGDVLPDARGAAALQQALVRDPEGRLVMPRPTSISANKAVPGEAR
jgi:hypothetical protein